MGRTEFLGLSSDTANRLIEWMRDRQIIELKVTRLPVPLTDAENVVFSASKEGLEPAIKQGLYVPDKPETPSEVIADAYYKNVL